LSTPKVREAYYDNLRLFLLFITVMCHSFKTIWKTHPLITDFYMILLLFVMPAFVVLTGFFAKGMAKPGSPARMRILNIGLIYVIAQLMKMMLVGVYSFFDPAYGNWYLVCIMVWYAALPALAKFKPQVVLSVSIIAALLVGLDHSHSTIMQMSRMVCFLPFFMLGFYISKDQAELLKKPKVRLAGAAILVITVIICVTVWNDAIPYRLMHADTNYELLKLSAKKGILLRLAWYIMASALGFGVLCIIPRKRNILTVLGTRTMPIYIIHTTVYHYLINKTELFVRIGEISRVIPRFTVMTLLAISVTLICGNKWFSKPFDLLLGYDFRHFMMKKEKE